MGKALFVSTEKTAILVLLVLLVVGLFGCAGTGRVVPVDKRIGLSDRDTSRGSFRQGGMTVAYSYRLAGNTLALDGQLSYFGGFDSLDLRLLFIDPAGTVLQQKIVYFSGYRVSSSWKTDHTFQATLAVPQGATGISFNYAARPRRSHH